MKNALIFWEYAVGTVLGTLGMAGLAWGACVGDEEVAGEWIFEEEADGWAVNTGFNGDVGNLGLTGGAAFSTNVSPVNCDCGHSLFLPGATGVAGAVSINDYDPLAGAEKFSILAWVRRDSAEGANLSARIFSDTDSTSLSNTTSGVEFRFSGNAGNLALRINGTEVSGTVGGIAPTNGEWHHVAVVYDGTRAATNYATRNVHFYVDGIQRGVGSVLQGVVVATNYAPVVVGNASPSRTAANLLARNVDDVLVVPGWAPDAVGNGNGSVFTDGIPATRDFATSGYVDNDLVALFLATEGGAGFGGEFRLSKLESGRSRIKVWDSIDKTNEIILPASWIAGTDQVPSTLWVEGLREGTRLRDAGLMLAYVHDGAIRSQDSVRLTVTPVLKTLSATPSNRQPGLVQDGSKFLAANDGLSAFGDPAIQFLAEVENLPNNPRGSLRLIQHAWLDCLLENGFGFHGHSGVLCKIYLNEPMASEGLVDSDATEFPFYHSEGLSLCVASGIDTPELGVYYPDVWPWREGFVSQIDIRMRFRLSAVWQFLDGTIYFLGDTTWNTRFQGELARPGTHTVFNAGHDNKTIGSATFFVDNTDYRTSSPIANTCYAYQYQQP